MNTNNDSISTTQEQPTNITASTSTRDDLNATADSTTVKSSGIDEELTPFEKDLYKHWQAIYYHLATIIDKTVEKEIKDWKETQLQELENDLEDAND